MKNKLRKVVLGTMVASTTLALASCGGGSKINYENFDFEDPSATVEVANNGTVENYVAAGYDKREEILGKLEEYAMKKNLTGIPLYADGGYVKYNPRLNIPTPVMKNSDGSEVVVDGTKRHEYITGYGFGVIEEGGKITQDLSGVDTYKRYYHTFELDDPKTLNYMNDKGSVVGGINPYFASGYFNTRMNKTKDGYEWFPSLATEDNVVAGLVRPIPYNGDKPDTTNSQLLSTKYRIYVRTGADAKYAIASTNSKVSTFNGREVKLEDYVTPWKELYNKANGLARGAENLTGASSLKGMADYYAASEAGAKAEDVEAAWNKVGVKTGTDNGKDYLEFEFNTPCTPFYAMYYLSGSLYAPIPQEFLTAIGGIKNWGSFSTDGLTPVDTTLSTGPMVVEKWQPDKEFVFKNNTALNPAIKGGEHRYQLDGIHYAVMPGAKTDKLLAWNEYQAGKLDTVGIPKDKLVEFKDKKDTQVTKGSSVTKLNVNTCTQAEWEYLFGVNGVVTQTPASEYYEVEPAMSNDDFIRGINFALNRQEYATNHGVTPSIDYFSDNYLIDPEAGKSYNETQTHKDVLKSVYGETVSTYGYNFDKAVESFSKAANVLLSSGAYNPGDKITIEIWWQAEAQIENNGAEIKAYLEKAFNNKLVCDNKLTLEVKNLAVTEWSDVYYKKTMVGQFDIGFGGISGNTLNPINFMEVLKSDNSSGFTLNWGPNTNDPRDGMINFDDKLWTFDALYQAADTGAVISDNGSLAKTEAAKLSKNVRNKDGSRTIEIKYAHSNIPGVVKSELKSVVLCWYDGPEYEEMEITDFTFSKGIISFTVSQEIADKYQGSVGFDIYLSQAIGNDAAKMKTVSLNGMFPYPEEGK